MELTKEQINSFKEIDKYIPDSDHIKWNTLIEKYLRSKNNQEVNKENEYKSKHK